ncbi:FAD/NAD(P)-binding domain-containing protein [Leucogyrophana mollusca]|uniref:FAD/NAD(P)-binding domain-containing protein n=1 Tax=Leucogyrophana mollusca TaxID=85980 RepID=A0ACB8BSF2_9AGAM|nr:FAD/NAD(P)-binding domain-containing protein [Leucogyrophana mollusca]
MDALNRKASLSIDIIIVGGSIAGLATAYRLCKAGHNVRVLEHAAGPHRYAAGARLPPNLTKILGEWGLGDKLVAQAQSIQGSQCLSLDTGEPLGYLLWQKEIMAELGSDFMLMHYADLHAMLYDIAIDAGAQILYNRTVVRVSAGPPRAVLSSGEELQADMIIGADGPSSIVREAIGVEDGAMIPEGHNLAVYSATIPRETLEKDSELNAFTSTDLGGPQYPIFMGHRRFAAGFSVRGGSEYSVSAFWPDDEADVSADGWDVSIPKETLEIDGVSKLHRLLRLSSDLRRIRYVDRESPSEWIDESGRLLLIGEAAHPSYPCTNHSCSLQVEDAEVLGTLFSRLSSLDQIRHFTEAFQELRQARCNAVHMAERIGIYIGRLPPGPDRNVRDDTLLAMMHTGREGWDDEKMRWQWEEISDVFGYSAREAAEGWWVVWGLLRERSKAREAHEGFYVPIEVTEVTTEQESKAHI